MLRSLLCIAMIIAAAPLHAEEEVVELFNGKNLDGWKGDAKVWSVEDGLLTGKSPAAEEDKLKSNTFAIWDGEVGDFELIAEFRLEGDNNSGVQYRAQANPKNGPYSIVGYQADIHPAANYTGMLYDEGGRGIAAERGQKVTLKADGKNEVKPLEGKFDPVDLSAWTTLEVKAVGNRLVHKINGDVTVDVTDEDPQNAEAKGLLALQVHAGPDMKVQYRSIKLKKLDK
ncbi:3-keto-disaccharide hydrolase [Lacipirellula limnantheis]|uniref:3-keto-alpha-glucoside-1,2-lyase/3-keto-2-hydroxy-glucal hydratase domain-containing protein n=1 Tax=Lacipirellula limnantheis TaxID=2528024 RepID=A0A517U643_9BACT|nr:DUF1080 domain-containing protein [Lacipirellula limnantheis]QDT76099.1 hypothetical protein I41_53440 [Lacipirellula limnantheis]